MGGQTVTYSCLDERQRRLTGLLAARGLRPGDRIAVLASNRPEVLEVTIGALRTGIVPVPVNALLAPAEVRFLLEDSGAAWLFADRSIEAPPCAHGVLTFGEPYERALAEVKPEPRLPGVALGRPMHYTSGTTGVPKGVWVEPKEEAAALAESRRFRRLWGISGEDVHLVCSPLTHSAPHRFALRTLEAGGTVVLQPKFDARETLAAISLYGVTSTFMVPTHLERIMGLEDELNGFELSTMRLLAHAGAAIRPETKRKVLGVFPFDSVWEFYGSTEGQATRISTQEWLRKPGSVGRALPGARIVIKSDEGRPLPPGEIGHVWVADPAAERFKYWGDDAKTAEAWDEDGAFTVGDMGHLDEDGYLFLAGRRHDLIISGGVNVYPQEVERALLEHPLVAEAAVYGEPDEEWGERVCAIVVPASESFDAAELDRWARARLAGYKRPRKVEVVTALPRTPTGKIKRAPPR
jgi:long-chain acyl-CoA synthetase